MKDHLQLLEEYFRDLREIHSTGGGVDEQSFYGSLEKLFNGIGKSLKPEVRCIIQLKNRGAGHPDGRTSETIFAIPGFSVGIQQGVATSLWIKKDVKAAETKIYFRDDIDAARAVERRKQLLDSLVVKDFNNHYQLANPSENNRCSFRPSKVSADYLAWPRLTELAVFFSNGLMEKRKGALIDIDRSALEKRMSLYYDENTDWQTLKNLQFGFTEDAARYNAQKTREKVLKNEMFSPERIRRYLIGPFDIQWCYNSPIRPLWNEPRPSLWQQYWKENSYFISRVATTKPTGGTPFYHTPLLSDDHLLTPDASCFQIRIRAQFSKNNKPKEQAHLIQPPDDEGKITANLSQLARDYLASLGIDNPDTDAHTASLVWMHALAIGYSPVYLNENADGIRKDWPRILLPEKRELLEASAALGEKVAALLDTEKLVSGVTASSIRPEIQTIAVITKEGGGQLQPKELGITAGWGHAGKNGVVFKGAVGPWYKSKRGDFHLYENAVKELIQMGINSYKEKTGKAPTEVFLHSKVRFDEYEWQGFLEGADPETKLVGVRIREDDDFKLFRTFEYPILRGMALILDEKSAYLWTKGFVPRLQTYVGREVPTPLSVEICRGDSDITVVLGDIMALTKLNYNTCIYADGPPVTLKFADAVGEILTAGPLGTIPPLSFKFYI